ncbi:hypothetical protein D3C81_2212600 [compost metagenome]
MGIARAQAVDSGIDDRCGCVEIRIADRQQQDVVALFQARQGAVVDIPGGGAVAGDALGQVGIAHGLYLVTWRRRVSVRSG